MQDRNFNTKASRFAAKQKAATRPVTAKYGSWRNKFVVPLLAAIPVLGLNYSGSAEKGLTGGGHRPEESANSTSGDPVERLTRLQFKKHVRRSVHRQHLKGSDLVSQFLGGSDDCPGTTIPSGQYTIDTPFTDGGDTTGANSTVSSLGSPYWVLYDALGPDEIYSFVIQSYGANARIRVSSEAPSYRPLVYIQPECPTGIGNGSEEYWAFVNPPAGGTAEFGPPWKRSVRYYLFVDSATGPGGPYSLQIRNLTLVQARRGRFDFDGDARSDISVFRPSEGRWYHRQSFQTTSWGEPGDIPLPGDLDGDGKSDLAVWRPSSGNWYIIRSTDGQLDNRQWGWAGDIPLTGNFDGDLADDLIIFRPTENRWYVQNSSGSITHINFGKEGAKPLLIDHDGDGISDLATYHNGIWRIRTTSSGSIKSFTWGEPNDIPVPADYDGDHKDDIAVWRPSNGRWYVLKSGSQNAWDIQQWGVAGDIPVPADYDGDGDADRAIFRDGAWYLLLHNNAVTSMVVNWGQPGDKPAPAAYISN